MNSDGTVELDGGLALGLGKGSELRKVGLSAGKPEVRVRITQLEGLSRSKAEIVRPSDASQIQPGDLFELTAWVAPENSRLQVWMPPATLSSANLLQVAAEAGKLRQAGNVKWIDDPVEVQPGLCDGLEWQPVDADESWRAGGKPWREPDRGIRFMNHLPTKGKAGIFPGAAAVE